MFHAQIDAKATAVPSPITQVFMVNPVRCTLRSAAFGTPGATTQTMRAQKTSTPIGFSAMAADTSPAQSAATARVLPQKGQG